MMSAVLPRGFYGRDTIEVARDLLGRVLVRETPAGRLAVKIVETEAYCGPHDKACHASKGMTDRNRVMFGEPGHAYVYFTYGFHYCLNFVTQPDGVAEAILIRALEPLEGIEAMKRNRAKEDIHELCSGPGKLAQALGIGTSLNGEDLLGKVLYVLDDGTDVGAIISRPRVGIKEAKDELWRFYPAAYSDWVSRK